MTNFPSLFHEIRGKKLTIVSGGKLQRIYDRALEVSSLEGQVAECGSYKGGVLRLLAKVLPHKQIYGFDTFTGMPGELVQPEIDGHKAGDFGDLTFESVKAAMADLPNVHLVPGVFPGTFAPYAGEQFCLVHLDCDLYLSYKAAIAFFWPRLADGGWMIFDDYDSHQCQGAWKAILEEFGEGRTWPITEVQRTKGHIVNG